MRLGHLGRASAGPTHCGGLICTNPLGTILALSGDSTSSPPGNVVLRLRQADMTNTLMETLTGGDASRRGWASGYSATLWLLSRGERHVMR